MHKWNTRLFTLLGGKDGCVFLCCFVNVCVCAGNPMPMPMLKLILMLALVLALFGLNPSMAGRLTSDTASPIKRVSWSVRTREALVLPFETLGRWRR